MTRLQDGGPGVPLRHPAAKHDRDAMTRGVRSSNLWKSAEYVSFRPVKVGLQLLAALIFFNDQPSLRSTHLYEELLGASLDSRDGFLLSQHPVRVVRLQAADVSHAAPTWQVLFPGEGDFVGTGNLNVRASRVAGLICGLFLGVRILFRHPFQAVPVPVHSSQAPPMLLRQHQFRPNPTNVGVHGARGYW